MPEEATCVRSLSCVDGLHSRGCPAFVGRKATPCPSVYPPSASGPYRDDAGWSGPLRCVMSEGHDGDRHWNTGINWTDAGHEATPCEPHENRGRDWCRTHWRPYSACLADAGRQTTPDLCASCNVGEHSSCVPPCGCTSSNHEAVVGRETTGQRPVPLPPKPDKLLSGSARSGREATCDHDRLLAYLRRSPYRSERMWLPISRLAVRFAHRGGVCRLTPPARKTTEQ